MKTFVDQLQRTAMQLHWISEDSKFVIPKEKVSKVQCSK